jgi:hypothetical protein
MMKCGTIFTSIMDMIVLMLRCPPAAAPGISFCTVLVDVQIKAMFITDFNNNKRSN